MGQQPAIVKLDEYRTYRGSIEFLRGASALIHGDCYCPWCNRLERTDERVRACATVLAPGRGRVYIEHARYSSFE